MPPEFRLRARAYHEAGHAVAALYAERDFAEVYLRSILPDESGGTGGLADFRLGVEYSGVLMCLAGMPAKLAIALELLEPQRAIEWVVDTGKCDIVYAWGLASEAACYSGSDKAPAIMSRAATEAARIVREYWRGVTAIATALLDTDPVESMSQAEWIVAAALLGSWVRRLAPRSGLGLRRARP